jgi:hypothetical protein
MFCVNDYFKRFKNTINKIENHGLYDSTNKIYVNMVGIDHIEESIISFVKNYDKIILSNNPNNASSEGHTLDLLWNKCKDFSDEDNILYLHSKGVWRAHSKESEKENIQDWIDLMEYFLIERWEEANSYLSNYDACGVNLQSIQDGHKHPHFSGNFWWASNSYIKKTKSFTDLFGYRIKQSSHFQPIELRIFGEWWLLNSLKDGVANPYCIYDSKVDHYTKRHRRSEYTTI